MIPDALIPFIFQKLFCWAQTVEFYICLCVCYLFWKTFIFLATKYILVKYIKLLKCSKFTLFPPQVVGFYLETNSSGSDCGDMDNHISNGIPKVIISFDSCSFHFQWPSWMLSRNNQFNNSGKRHSNLWCRVVVVNFDCDFHDFRFKDVLNPPIGVLKRTKPKSVGEAAAKTESHPVTSPQAATESPTSPLATSTPDSAPDGSKHSAASSNLPCRLSMKQYLAQLVDLKFEKFRVRLTEGSTHSVITCEAREIHMYSAGQIVDPAILSAAPVAPGRSACDVPAIDNCFREDLLCVQQISGGSVHVEQDGKLAVVYTGNVAHLLVAMGSGGAMSITMNVFGHDSLELHTFPFLAFYTHYQAAEDNSIELKLISPAHLDPSGKTRYMLCNMSGQMAVTIHDPRSRLGSQTLVVTNIFGFIGTLRNLAADPNLERGGSSARKRKDTKKYIIGSVDSLVFVNPQAGRIPMDPLDPQLACIRGMHMRKELLVHNSYAAAYRDKETMAVSCDTVCFHRCSTELLEWMFILQDISNNLPNSRFAHVKTTTMTADVSEMYYNCYASVDSTNIYRGGGSAHRAHTSIKGLNMHVDRLVPDALDPNTSDMEVRFDQLFLESEQSLLHISETYKVECAGNSRVSPEGSLCTTVLAFADMVVCCRMTTAAMVFKYVNIGAFDLSVWMHLQQDCEAVDPTVRVCHPTDSSVPKHAASTYSTQFMIFGGCKTEWGMTKEQHVADLRRVAAGLSVKHNPTPPPVGNDVENIFVNLGRTCSVNATIGSLVKVNSSVACVRAMVNGITARMTKVKALSAYFQSQGSVRWCLPAENETTGRAECCSFDDCEELHDHRPLTEAELTSENYIDVLPEVPPLPLKSQVITLFSKTMLVHIVLKEGAVDLSAPNTVTPPSQESGSVRPKAQAGLIVMDLKFEDFYYTSKTIASTVREDRSTRSTAPSMSGCISTGSGVSWRKGHIFINPHYSTVYKYREYLRLRDRQRQWELLHEQERENERQVLVERKKREEQAKSERRSTTIPAAGLQWPISPMDAAKSSVGSAFPWSVQTPTISRLEIASELSAEYNRLFHEDKDAFMCMSNFNYEAVTKAPAILGAAGAVVGPVVAPAHPPTQRQVISMDECVVYLNPNNQFGVATESLLLYRQLTTDVVALRSPPSGAPTSGGKEDSRLVAPAADLGLGKGTTASPNLHEEITKPNTLTADMKHLFIHFVAIKAAPLERRVGSDFKTAPSEDSNPSASPGSVDSSATVSGPRPVFNRSSNVMPSAGSNPMDQDVPKDRGHTLSGLHVRSHAKEAISRVADSAANAVHMVTAAAAASIHIATSEADTEDDGVGDDCPRGLELDATADPLNQTGNRRDLLQRSADHISTGVNAIDLQADFDAEAALETADGLKMDPIKSPRQRRSKSISFSDNCIFHEGSRSAGFSRDNDSPQSKFAPGSIVGDALVGVAEEVELDNEYFSYDNHILLTILMTNYHVSLNCSGQYSNRAAVCEFLQSCDQEPTSDGSSGGLGGPPNPSQFKTAKDATTPHSSEVVYDYTGISGGYLVQSTDSLRAYFTPSPPPPGRDTGPDRLVSARTKRNRVTPRPASSSAKGSGRRGRPRYNPQFSSPVGSVPDPEDGVDANSSDKLPLYSTGILPTSVVPEELPSGYQEFLTMDKLTIEGMVYGASITDPRIALSTKPVALTEARCNAVVFVDSAEEEESLAILDQELYGLTYSMRTSTASTKVYAHVSNSTETCTVWLNLDTMAMLGLVSYMIVPISPPATDLVSPHLLWWDSMRYWMHGQYNCSIGQLTVCNETVSPGSLAGTVVVEMSMEHFYAHISTADFQVTAVNMNIIAGIEKFSAPVQGATFLGDKHHRPGLQADSPDARRQSGGSSPRRRLHSTGLSGDPRAGYSATNRLKMQSKAKPGCYFARYKLMCVPGFVLTMTHVYTVVLPPAPYSCPLPDFESTFHYNHHCVYLHPVPIVSDKVPGQLPYDKYRHFRSRRDKLQWIIRAGLFDFASVNEEFKRVGDAYTGVHLPPNETVVGAQGASAHPSENPKPPERAMSAQPGRSKINNRVTTFDNPLGTPPLSSPTSRSRSAGGRGVGTEGYDETIPSLPEGYKPTEDSCGRESCLWLPLDILRDVQLAYSAPSVSTEEEPKEKKRRRRRGAKGGSEKHGRSRSRTASARSNTSVEAVASPNTGQCMPETPTGDGFDAAAVGQDIMRSVSVDSGGGGGRVSGASRDHNNALAELEGEDTLNPKIAGMATNAAPTVDPVEIDVDLDVDPGAEQQGDADDCGDVEVDSWNESSDESFEGSDSSDSRDELCDTRKPQDAALGKKGDVDVSIEKSPSDVAPPPPTLVDLVSQVDFQLHIDSLHVASWLTVHNQMGIVSSQQKIACETRLVRQAKNGPVAVKEPNGDQVVGVGATVGTHSALLMRHIYCDMDPINIYVRNWSQLDAEELARSREKKDKPDEEEDKATQSEIPSPPPVETDKDAATVMHSAHEAGPATEKVPPIPAPAKVSHATKPKGKHKAGPALSVDVELSEPPVASSNASDTVGSELTDPDIIFPMERIRELFKQIYRCVHARKVVVTLTRGTQLTDKRDYFGGMANISSHFRSCYNLTLIGALGQTGGGGDQVRRRMAQEARLPQWSPHRDHLQPHDSSHGSRSRSASKHGRHRGATKYRKFTIGNYGTGRHFYAAFMHHFYVIRRHKVHAAVREADAQADGRYVSSVAGSANLSLLDFIGNHRCLKPPMGLLPTARPRNGVAQRVGANADGRVVLGVERSELGPAGPGRIRRGSSMMSGMMGFLASSSTPVNHQAKLGNVSEIGHQRSHSGDVSPGRMSGRVAIGGPVVGKQNSGDKIWGLRIVDLRLLWSLAIRDCINEFVERYVELFTTQVETSQPPTGKEEGGTEADETDQEAANPGLRKDPEYDRDDSIDLNGNQEERGDMGTVVPTEASTPMKHAPKKPRHQHAESLDLSLFAPSPVVAAASSSSASLSGVRGTPLTISSALSGSLIDEVLLGEGTWGDLSKPALPRTQAKEMKPSLRVHDTAFSSGGRVLTKQTAFRGRRRSHAAATAAAQEEAEDTEAIDSPNSVNAVKRPSVVTNGHQVSTRQRRFSSVETTDAVPGLGDSSRIALLPRRKSSMLNRGSIAGDIGVEPLFEVGGPPSPPGGVAAGQSASVNVSPAGTDDQDPSAPSFATPGPAAEGGPSTANNPNLATLNTFLRYFFVELIDPQINILDVGTHSSLIICAGKSSLEGSRQTAATVMQVEEELFMSPGAAVIASGGDGSKELEQYAREQRVKQRNDIRLKMDGVSAFTVPTNLVYMDHLDESDEIDEDEDDFVHWKVLGYTADTALFPSPQEKKGGAGKKKVSSFSGKRMSGNASDMNESPLIKTAIKDFQIRMQYIFWVSLSSKEASMLPINYTTDAFMGNSMLDLPEICMDLDSQQFYITLNVIRNVLLAPPPITGTSLRKKNKTSDEDLEEEENARAAARAHNDVIKRDGKVNTTPLDVNTYASREELRPLVDAYFTKKITSDDNQQFDSQLLSRFVEFFVGKGIWIMRGDEGEKLIEVAFTGVYGTHSYYENMNTAFQFEIQRFWALGKTTKDEAPVETATRRSSVSKLTRRLSRSLSGREKEKIPEPDLAQYILYPALEETEPCARCKCYFKLEDNAANSCVFHADSDGNPGVFSELLVPIDGTGAVAGMDEFAFDSVMGESPAESQEAIAPQYRKVLAWSCCGETNKFARGCTSRPHLCKEMMLIIRAQASPIVTVQDSNVDISILPRLEISIFPAAAAYCLQMLMTRALADVIHSYLSMGGVSIDPDTEAGEHAEGMDALSEAVAAEAVPAPVPTAIVPAKQTDKNRRQEGLFINYLRVGEINLDITTAGFPVLFNVEALKIKITQILVQKKLLTWPTLISMLEFHAGLCVTSNIASDSIGRFSRMIGGVRNSLFHQENMRVFIPGERDSDEEEDEGMGPWGGVIDSGGSGEEWPYAESGDENDENREARQQKQSNNPGLLQVFSAAPKKVVSGRRAREEQRNTQHETSKSSRRKFSALQLRGLINNRKTSEQTKRNLLLGL